MENTVSLPWPPKALSANSRKQHRYSTAERKQYKQDCWALTKAENIDRSLSHLDITFHPPDARRRDLDNMLSGVKYAIDGVAAALGVDDYTFSMTIRRGAPLRPCGEVIIKFR
jgi:crossover junction endodeoxyribonuclease RusA